MGYKVLTPLPIGRAASAYLRDHGFTVIEGHGDDEQSLLDLCGDCDAMIVRLPTINERILAASPKLRIISRLGVGYDCIDLEAARRHKVIVATAFGANAMSVAELTMLLMLSCAWQLKATVHRWHEDYLGAALKLRRNELCGKTLGIVGAGTIGQIVAKKAALGFDMKVIAWNRSRRDLPEYITQIDDRDELFRQSDFVSLHVASTPETRHSISRHELALMKPTAFLVNTARGNIIDEPALIAALQAKQIAGAALDVMEVEPFDQNSPLTQMDNVLLTPHIASQTKESNLRVTLAAAKAVDDFLHGRDPDYVVPELRDLLAK